MFFRKKSASTIGKKKLLDNVDLLQEIIQQFQILPEYQSPATLPFIPWAKSFPKYIELKQFMDYMKYTTMKSQLSSCAADHIGYISNHLLQIFSALEATKSEQEGFYRTLPAAFAFIERPLNEKDSEEKLCKIEQIYTLLSTIIRKSSPPLSSAADSPFSSGQVTPTNAPSTPRRPASPPMPGMLMAPIPALPPLPENMDDLVLSADTLPLPPLVASSSAPPLPAAPPSLPEIPSLDAMRKNSEGLASRKVGRFTPRGPATATAFSPGPLIQSAQPASVAPATPRGSIGPRPNRPAPTLPPSALPE